MYYSIRVLQNSHRILGKDVYEKNMDFFRGKLKTTSNYVPFSFDNKLYQKYFIEPNNVKMELYKLFDLWNLLDDESISSVFAKYVILQIELIAIHPFIDGNGRVSRALSESYLESYNFIPYTPYSTEYKREYQDMMARYSVEAVSDLKLAYGIIAKYFLNGYKENVNDIIEAVSKLSKSI